MSVTFNIAVPFGITKVDHYDSFLQTLIAAGNKVRTKTRRVTPNILIVGETGSNVIESMTKFKPASTLGSAGPHILGTLANRYLCVYSPYYPADKGVLAYRGDVILDTGYIYRSLHANYSYSIYNGRKLLWRPTESLQVILKSLYLLTSTAM